MVRLSNGRELGVIKMYCFEIIKNVEFYLWEVALLRSKYISYPYH